MTTERVGESINQMGEENPLDGGADRTRVDDDACGRRRV